MGRRSDHSREQLTEMIISAALKLVALNGLRGVTARAVAKEIGYTVGTLYNLFGNLDDLVRHMNAATMDALYDYVTASPINDNPEKALRTLARRYLAFVRDHPRQWSAVIEFEPRDTASVPVWYKSKAERLLLLGDNAIAPLFDPAKSIERRHHAHVLWGALYGITALAQTTSLPEGKAADALIDALVSTYIAGIKAQQEQEIM
jgi:AcrR family transcriptional regulator